MFRPSVSSIISGLFLAYISNSIWSVLRLYFPPTCESDKLCLTNFLVKNPEILFLFLSSTKSQPTVDGDLNYLGHLDLLNPSSAEPVSHQISLNLPKAVTHRNGSLYLAIFSLPLPKDASQLSYRKKWAELIRHPDATYTLEKLTAHQIPEAKAFNLLQRDDEKPEVSHSKVVDAPVVHVKTKIFIGIMVDDVDIPSVGIPGEIYHLIKLREPERKSYLPIVYVDELSHRLADLRLVNSTDSSTEISVIYRSFGWGKLRMLLQFSSAMHSMKGLGFNDKDLDEVKGIFADTNVVLLLVTMAVSAVHLLFDFLAFKNDVEFWKGRTNMTGLSTRTLLWRAFSQTVIFFYLLEEKTSMLVLVPSAIAAVIEIWKVRKAFGFSFRKGGIYRKFGGGDDDKAEKYTERLDSQAMKYLARVLYPLLTGGAVYSLLYMPHKSWRSWTMQSLVNAVYAFGFLFMLPQLFVNYRLKSVAHLPWRAFAYKAFNTFIDDLFAFIITMPTAHRVACLRDDVVFVIYLYQRYLYPVDKNRVDLSGMIDETVDDDVQRSQNVISPEKGSTPKKKVD